MKTTCRYEVRGQVPKTKYERRPSRSMMRDRAHEREYDSKYKSQYDLRRKSHNFGVIFRTSYFVPASLCLLLFVFHLLP